MLPELVESAHRVAAQLAPVAGGTLVKGLLVSRAVVAAAECGAAVPTEEGTCNRAARPPAVSTRTARPVSSTSGDGGGGGGGGGGDGDGGGGGGGGEHRVSGFAGSVRNPWRLG